CTVCRTCAAIADQHRRRNARGASAINRFSHSQRWLFPIKIDIVPSQCQQLATPHTSEQCSDNSWIHCPPTQALEQRLDLLTIKHDDLFRIHLWGRFGCCCVTKH